jgi:pimeloyl-ACP methyl ester carboxylesterase
MAKNASSLYSIKSGNAKAKINIFWLPTWGQTMYSWEHVEPAFDDIAINHLIDFPGFGQAPASNRALFTADYAQMLADYISENTNSQSKNFIVGHGFGAQVAIVLAAKNSKLNLDGIILIGAGGFKDKTSWFKKIIQNVAKRFGKFCYKIHPKFHEFMLKLYASNDFINSQGMRKTYLNVISENISVFAHKINTPTYLIYGSIDYLNPSIFGVKYHTMIKNSTLTILPNLDNETLLSKGAERIEKLIASAIEEQR